MLAALVARRVLRAPVPFRALATASTPYVPPASLTNLADAPPPQFRSRKKTKPASPSFYTSRADYFDHLYQLDDALSHCRRALGALELLPLPPAARASLPPAQSLWRSRQSMTMMFAGRLTTARYRRVVTVLAALDECARVAVSAGHPALARTIRPVLELYERHDKADVLARTARRAVPLDRFGRSYTVGKRKESTARVWMIPVRVPSPVPAVATPTPAAVAADPTAPTVPDAFARSPEAPRARVPTTTILVNNAPLHQYFATPADRERVVRPLKLAGVLGAYNVFVIVRGGGTTGQAGAAAHGIARGIVAHAPELDLILRKAKLMKRDPRMVERKKTGLAKARKRYAWVKR
ncbi:ribosomal protein S9/S16-domain-containing protein [Gloeopeniophorella convolvens]|nr:ribosomal protein S9/S16-domain-containing protein [Gloeopeniophorella convolvens]